MIKTVFFGTPDFAKTFLEALHADEDIFVSAVVAQPDKPIGRKKILTAPPTKKFAIENDILVLQPESLKEPNILEQLKKIDPDLFVIVAYGKIIPQTILDIPKNGSINVHPSLLPKYRGPSPIQAAIANQETETGVSIMLIDEKMDHGPILLQKKMAIENETSEALLEKAGVIGAPMLLQAIKGYLNGTILPVAQNHDEATFCKLIKKEDGKIDWNDSAESIKAKFRAYQPWPGIFTIWNDRILKLIDVQIPNEAIESLDSGEVRIYDKRLFIGTGTLTIEILKIQPEGKAAMSVVDFINGNKEIDRATLI